MEIEPKQAKRQYTVVLDEDEITVLIHRLSGSEGFLAQRIERTGQLPENHDELAFQMEEKLRKAVR